MKIGDEGKEGQHIHMYTIVKNKQKYLSAVFSVSFDPSFFLVFFTPCQNTKKH